MLCSIIIPCFNSTKHIENCLESLLLLPKEKFEIILVDDFSSDELENLIEKYQLKIIKNLQNYGPSYSRNVGAAAATGDVLCFIDSDISITPERILSNLQFILNSDEGLAITGGVGKKSPYNNFFSKYKNYYLHYTFGIQPDFVSFFYGAFVMVKKSDFKLWPEYLRYGEDTYLGNDYCNSGKKIFFDKQLNAIHYKKLNFLLITANDFYVPFFFSKTYVNNFNESKTTFKLEFSHALRSQLTSIALVGVFWLYLVFCTLFLQADLLLISFILLCVWLFVNRLYFSFLANEESPFFTIRSILFTFMDQTILGAGIFCGLIYHGFLHGSKIHSKALF
ncbi:MAG: glycosyltransferase family 2 protein [Rhizobacter sp.]|nr:glycosyltransferase family 2 protein [Bacteriovorax sp.]